MTGTHQAPPREKGNGTHEESTSVRDILDKLREVELLSGLQHRLLTIVAPKMGEQWTEEKLLLAGNAVVKLHNEGNAWEFVSKAKIELPIAHEDVAMFGPTITRMFGENVSLWLAAVFYIMVAANEKPELLDTI